jgi:ubiquinone/menaquinone biosynthesis C-methylase UbiE
MSDISPQQWDTTSHEDFYKYYEQQSLSPQTLERFRLTTEMLLRHLAKRPAGEALDVLDVGCGAGSQSRFWLERGHHYWGLDINEPLIQLARRRAEIEQLTASFDVGTATALPWADESMDVCLLPELLEHVEDWESCVKEAIRVLRPGGLLYINTSSCLCPVQQEFNLPLYSWYPAPLKRHFEHRAKTDKPALANFAKYPAVNWFSFYELRRYLSARGLDSLDRFDIVDLAAKSGLGRVAFQALRSIAPLRVIGHLVTPYTLVVGRKRA